MYFETTRAPMGNAELDALHGLLEQRSVPFKGMSLEMLDGFLSAIAVGPEPVSAVEWLPLVWGGRPPRWESLAESDRVEAMLMALWKDVARRVAVDPVMAEGADHPLIAMPPPDESGTAPEFRTGNEWAAGFLEGVDLRADAWEKLIGSEQWIDEALWSIQAIAYGEWPEPDGKPSSGPLPYAERLELIEGIPQILYELNALRFENLVSHEPIRKLPSPGRNDPCSCGSGKKYKKCCGAGS